MAFFDTKKCRLILFIAALFMMMQAVSCQSFSSYSRQVLSDEEINGCKSIVLKVDDRKRCNMLVSPDVQRMLENDNGGLYYDSLLEYVDIISDEAVDSRMICIVADLSSYLEGFTAYDANMYKKAVNNMDDDIINELMPKDYYVMHDKKYVLFVCGSAEMSIDFLKELSNDFFKKGSLKESNYLSAIPDEGLYTGEYIKGMGIGDSSIDKFRIISPAAWSASGGYETSNCVYDFFRKNAGVKLEVKKGTEEQTDGCELVVGNTMRPVSAEYYESQYDITEYKIIQKDKSLYIMGGSDWAMTYAFNLLAEDYFKKNVMVPAGFEISGSIKGMCLVPREDGADLRLMTNNIWEEENDLAEWKGKPFKSPLSVRMETFASVYMYYAPDVVCLQEIPNSKYTLQLVELLAQNGYKYEMVDMDERINCTPLIYNSERLELIDSGFYRYEKGSNHYSKSYTWACFNDKVTGERFAAVSTHLWWKNNEAFDKSTFLRTIQFEDLGEITDDLQKKYDCPCFVMGDTNCQSYTNEFKTISRIGLLDTHEIAKKHDDTIGMYVCADAKKWTYRMRGGTYQKNAIDHIFVRNAKGIEVLSYNIEGTSFMCTLTDHAPVYIDVKFKKES